MKNLFLSLLFLTGLITATSCSDEQEFLLPDKIDSPNTESNSIIEHAKKAYEMCYGSNSRSAAVFYAHDIVPVTNIKSRAASPDTVLYIVNEAEGNGFVALTGGNRPEILAVSDCGTIDNLNDIDIPGLKIFFDAATTYAALIPDGPILPPTPVDPIPYFKEEEYTEEDHCDPLCTTQWGQEYPEGLFCPNKICGCVITATAQALSYYTVPASIVLSYPNADKSTVSLDWNAMKSLVTSMTWFVYNYAAHNPKPAQLEAEYNLGRLCRELGQRMDPDYGPNGTSISLDDMARVVNSLCPTLTVSGRFKGAPKKRNTGDNEIIVMQGTDSNLSETHAWIVDGFKYNAFYHNEYRYNPETKTYDFVPEYSYKQITDLQHINWGFNGINNGYYKVDVFNASYVVEPDTDQNSLQFRFADNCSYYIYSPK